MKNNHQTLTLSRNIENSFDKLIRDILSPPIDEAHYTQTPRIRVAENETGYRIEALMPGIGKKNVELSMEENMLIIEGIQPEVNDRESYNTLRNEINEGNYHRKIKLPNNANTQSIQAQYKDGILHLSIPKKEEAKPKRITIK